MLDNVLPFVAAFIEKGTERREIVHIRRMQMYQSGIVPDVPGYTDLWACNKKELNNLKRRVNS